MRSCSGCGGDLPPQVKQGRPRSKCEACSPKRVRRDRVAQLRPVTPIGAAVVEADDLSSEVLTRRLLVDVLDHPQAAIALRLARRIDSSQDSGTGMKALQQSHAAACEVALASRQSAGSALDELRRQRERRIGVI